MKSKNNSMIHLPAYIGVGGYEIEKYIIEVYCDGHKVPSMRLTVHCEEDVIDYIEQLMMKGAGYSWKISRVERMILEIENDEGEITTI